MYPAAKLALGDFRMNTTVLQAFMDFLVYSVLPMSGMPLSFLELSENGDADTAS